MVLIKSHGVSLQISSVQLYVHVCVCMCTRVCMCYFFRTVNRMKHLEIPLHILVLEFKPENILMAFK